MTHFLKYVISKTFSVLFLYLVVHFFCMFMLLPCFCVINVLNGYATQCRIGESYDDYVGGFLRFLNRCSPFVDFRFLCCFKVFFISRALLLSNRLSYNVIKLMFRRVCWAIWRCLALQNYFNGNLAFFRNVHI